MKHFTKAEIHEQIWEQLKSISGSISQLTFTDSQLNEIQQHLYSINQIINE